MARIFGSFNLYEQLVCRTEMPRRLPVCAQSVLALDGGDLLGDLREVPPVREDGDLN